MKPIVFISGEDSDTQLKWLSLLKQCLPDETILLTHQLGDAQAGDVEIAIVANAEAKILKRFPNLIWIQSLWAGVEKMLDELPHQKIQLVRLVDPQLAETMAEAGLAWTLYLHRNMPDYARQQQHKQWRQLPCLTAQELRVGVLGAGALGRATISALNEHGYQVNCWSRSLKTLDGVNSYTDEDGLQSMLANTDILINLLPLTAHTHRLLNRQRLSQLPRGAKVINFSRGAVLDTAALLDLLDQGQLAHAVLDVFEQEPLSPESPLWSHPKITVLPHISAPTNMASAAKIAARNIMDYRSSGTVPHAVDPHRGY